MEKSKSFCEDKFCKPPQITLSEYHHSSNTLFYTFTVTSMYKWIQSTQNLSRITPKSRENGL